MFKSPVFYACVAFFVLYMSTAPSHASDFEPEGVYCKVEAHKYKRSGKGLWGFLKDTLTCEVEIDYDVDEFSLDGSTDIEVSWEDSSNMWEKAREWFRKD